MPPRCRQVLEALLDSATAEIGGQCCLDLTDDTLGAAWFDANGVAWRAADTLGADDRFALVICSTATIHTGLRHVDAQGALLVFAPSGPRAATWSTDNGIVSRASVRSAEGDWHLCNNDTQAAAPYEVSVIVTCCDQARYLATLVTTLAADDSGINWELVIADRGSFDETGALLRSLQGDVRLLARSRRALESDALDAAIHACAGRLAVVIDPRLNPRASWLAALLQAADEHSDALAFAGRIGDAAPSAASLTPAALPPFAVRTAAYRARGGMDPTLPVADAISDVQLRLGTACEVAELCADIGEPLPLPRAG